MDLQLNSLQMVGFSWNELTGLSPGDAKRCHGRKMPFGILQGNFLMKT